MQRRIGKHLSMSQNLIVSNIAETVGEAAKQGANSALQNLATNNIVQTAIAGAHTGINQLTTTVTYASQLAPINSTTTVTPNRVTFGANGNPVSGATSVTLAPGARDSNGRLYVFSGPTGGSFINYAPPGGNDDANAIARQLAAETPTGDPVQDAILYGPEALRQRAVIPLGVTIPLDTVQEAVDDGLKPQTTPPPIIYGRRVEREDSGGWPAGIRIEDRSKYGPQGDLARDIIPASVVSAIVGNNPTYSSGWWVRIAFALALLLLIIYIIKRVIDDAEKKKEFENTPTAEYRTETTFQ